MLTFPGRCAIATIWITTLAWWTWTDRSTSPTKFAYIVQ